MSVRWKATILCWPYSGVDQKEAGDRSRVVDLGYCADVKDALSKATMFALGLEASAKVWRAPIVKLEEAQ